MRRWRRDDVDAVLRLVTESLDHLAPWMTWANSGYGRTDAVEYIEKRLAGWNSGEAFHYAILASDREIIGSCGLMARIAPGGLEIGYWLHPQHTGRGVASRAAGALAEEAFRVGAARVEIAHDIRNHASGAVPERLGFIQVGRRLRRPERVASGEVGIDVVWRRRRPLTGP